MPMAAAIALRKAATRDNTLHEGALRRRRKFHSREAALAAFSGKPPLSHLHPACLRAYVDYGFRCAALSLP